MKRLTNFMSIPLTSIEFTGAIILVTILSACSVKTAERDTALPTSQSSVAPQQDAPQIAQAQAEKAMPIPDSITQATDLPAAKDSENSKAPASDQSAAHATNSHAAPANHGHAHGSTHGHSESGVAPEKALGWLKNGNSRFLSGKLRKDGQSSKDVERLSKGQKPHSIIFSCSDSRVPPEVVFDQKLGEIFVVRNAGESPESASIASMEYAVEHLGAKLIVVMGHTHCGAVKAALGTLEGGDAGSPSLNSLVKSIHPHLQKYKGQKMTANVAEESTSNVRGAIEDILSKSSLLKSKVESGEVQIKAALYTIEDGRVEFLK